MELEKRIETLQAELDKIKAEVSKPVERELLTDYEKIWDNLDNKYGSAFVSIVVKPLHYKINAIIRCLEIAHYLNDGWVPDWEDKDKWKHGITLNHDNELDIICRKLPRYRIDSLIWLKDKKLAVHMIEHFSEIILEAIA